MSHIVEFTVKGLAGKSEPIHKKLDRHLNIFYGLNGSGKTSLLKILHSSMTGNAEILRNVPFTEATVKIYSILYNKIFTRSISKKMLIEDSSLDLFPEHLEKSEITDIIIKRHQRNEQIRWTQAPQMSEDKESEITSWQHRYLPTSRLHLTEDMRLSHSEFLPDKSLTEEQLDIFFAESLKKLWKNYSSDILIAVRKAQEEGLASILRAVLSTAKKRSKTQNNIDLEKAYLSVKNFLKQQGSPRIIGKFEDFLQRYKTDDSLQQVVQDIYAIELQIDEATAPQRQLQIGNLYSGNKKVIFEDMGISVRDENDKLISLASLSSGEKHLIWILVETLLVKESSIMVDEPELSMHIDWQKKLVAIMQILNPKAQFILASHSPEIMADVADDKILSL
jgi:predicted ATPase